MGDGILEAIPGLMATAIMVDVAGKVIGKTSKPLRQRQASGLHPMRINPRPVRHLGPRKAYHESNPLNAKKRSSDSSYNVSGIIS